MTLHYNPYAPPSSSLERFPDKQIWREGKLVVLEQQGIMPSRCIKCNEPAEEPIKTRNVYWHHRAFYLLFFINILIYVIVALIVRRKATINPGLCRQHKSKRTRMFVIGLLGSIFSIILCISGVAVDSASVSLVGIFSLMGFLVFTVLATRIVYPSKIDANYTRLKGAGKPFLDSLPEFIR